MFIFLKLYLAHLIGDFILQFEELYRLKLRNRWGYVFHVLIHAVLSLLIVFPYLDEPMMWMFVFIISGIHYVQDTLKYEWTEKSENQLFLFVGDQIFHAVLLSAAFLLPFSHEVRGFAENAIWNPVYQNNTWTLAGIAFVLSTFGGSYLFHAFYQNYVSKNYPLRFINRLEMGHAIFERGIVVWIVMFSESWIMILLSPAIGLLRFFFKSLKSWKVFVSSLIYAFVVGVAFRMLLINVL